MLVGRKTITVGYLCKGDCSSGTYREIGVHERTEIEHLSEFMKRAQKAVSLHHSYFSPACKSATMDLRLPLKGRDGRIGTAT